jgi:hypothetical protein
MVPLDPDVERVSKSLAIDLFRLTKFGGGGYLSSVILQAGLDSQGMSSRIQLVAGLNDSQIQ